MAACPVGHQHLSVRPLTLEQNKSKRDLVDTQQQAAAFENDGPVAARQLWPAVPVVAVPNRVIPTVPNLVAVNPAVNPTWSSYGRRRCVVNALGVRTCGIVTNNSFLTGRWGQRDVGSAETGGDLVARDPRVNCRLLSSGRKVCRDENNKWPNTTKSDHSQSDHSKSEHSGGH